jgi:tryptophanyl-tRNA synthetase
MSKKVLLSGVKPTGRPHIGNYFGAMRQFVSLQDEYDAHIFIADLHALTTVQNREEMEENTLGVLLDYMAIGLDPKKVTLYKQSDVPQVAELAWIFNCLTTMPYLERAHAYKDAVANGKEATVGLFEYPLLMAADILLPEADVVPVGQDQKQHIEIARDTAQKFNNAFGQSGQAVFKLPEPMILADMATVPGTDGRKMSKSYGNTIPLFASDEEIEKAVMGIVTDSGAEIPQNVYAIHALLRNKNDLEVIYAENKGQYKKLKELLIEDLKAFVKPMRERRQALEEDKNAVLEVLKAGGKAAFERAEKKMEQVRELVGLKLY